MAVEEFNGPLPKFVDETAPTVAPVAQEFSGPLPQFVDEGSSALQADGFGVGPPENAQPPAALKEPWSDTFAHIPAQVRGLAARTIAGMQLQSYEELNKADDRQDVTPKATADRAAREQHIKDLQGVITETVNDPDAQPSGEQNILQRGVQGAASSLAVSLPSMAVGILTRSPTLAASAAYPVTQAENYADLRNKGTSPERAGKYSGLNGMIEVGTELLPAKELFKTGSEPYKKLVRFMAEELPGESAATIGQTVSDALAKLPDDATAGEVVDTLKSSSWGGIKVLPETAVTTLLAGGAQHGAVTLADKAAQSQHYAPIALDRIYKDQHSTASQTAVDEQMPQTLAAQYAEETAMKKSQAAADSAVAMMSGSEIPDETQKTLDNVSEEAMMGYAPYKALRDQGATHEAALTEVASDPKVAWGVSAAAQNGAEGADLDVFMRKWLGRMSPLTALKEKLSNSGAEWQKTLTDAVANVDDKGTANSIQNDELTAATQNYERMRRAASDPAARISKADLDEAKTRLDEAAAAKGQAALVSRKLNPEPQKQVAQGPQEASAQGVEAEAAPVTGQTQKAGELNEHEIERLASLGKIASADTIEAPALTELVSGGFAKIGRDGRPMLLPQGRRQLTALTKRQEAAQETPAPTKADQTPKAIKPVATGDVAEMLKTGTITDATAKALLTAAKRETGEADLAKATAALADEATQKTPPTEAVPAARAKLKLPPERRADFAAKKEALVTTTAKKAAAEKEAADGAVRAAQARVDLGRATKMLAQEAPKAVKPAKPMAQAIASKPLRFDEKTVGTGEPLKKGQRVVMVDPRKLLAAHDRANPSYAKYDKVENVKKFGVRRKLSLAEVDDTGGSPSITNGRNRLKAAAESGATSVPIATYSPEAMEKFAPIAEAKYEAADPQGTGAPRAAGGPTPSDRLIAKHRKVTPEEQMRARLDRETTRAKELLDEAQDNAAANLPRGTKAGVQATIKHLLGLPAFKRWFGKSVVVDGQGAPLTVYRGTDFSSLTTTSDISKKRGLFFTDDPATANNYASDPDSDPSVSPVFLSLQNPLRVDAKGSQWSSIEVPGYGMMATDEISALAFQLGHDGVEIRNVVDRRPGANERIAQPATVYAVASMTQAKSAIGNSGAFDPADADITRRAGGATGSTPHVVDAVAARVKRAFGIDVKVVATPMDLPNIGQLRLPDTRGSFVFYPDGTGQMYMVRSNHSSELDAVKTAVHEIVGHYGLRGLLGGSKSPEYARVMGQIRASFPQKAKALAIATKIKWDHPDPAVRLRQRNLAAEELVAYATERLLTSRKKQSMWAKVVATTRRLLRSLGILDGWKVADIEDLIYRARDSVVKNNVKSETAKAEFESQIENAPRAAGPETPAFKRWFRGSKARTKDGRPMVLYHGTNKEFTEFQTAAGARSKMVGDWDGIHFTNDRDQAERIAKSLARTEGGSPRVVAAYLRAENPAPFGKYDTLESAKAAGHDSRLTENNSGLQEWTVFDPRQIKSATGNSGAFDPADADIVRAGSTSATEDDTEHPAARIRKTGDPALDSFLNKIGLPELTLRQRWQEWTSTWKENSIYHTVDELYGIYAAEMESGVSMADSGYIDARMARGATLLTQAIVTDGVPVWQNGVPTIQPGTVGFAPILKALSDKVGDDVRLFGPYLVARRAQRLATEGRENLFDSADIAAGMRLEQHPEFKIAAAAYDKLQKGVLDFAEAAGYIDPASRAVWEKGDYIPFYRVNSPHVGRPGSLGRVKDAVRQLRGGQDNIGDPIENIMRNWMSLIEGSLKAKATRTIVDNLNGTGKVTLAAPGGSTPTVQQFLQSNPAITSMLRAAGMNIGALTHAQLQGLQSIAQQPLATEGEAVTVWRGGKKEIWNVHDPLLFRSMVNINQALWHPLFEFLKAPKRLVTGIITSTPAFAVRNLMRDMFHAAVVGAGNSHTTIVPVVDTVKGVLSQLRKDQTAIELAAGGGAFSHGFIQSSDMSGAAKAVRRMTRKGNALTRIIDTPAKAWGLWRDLLNASENSNRSAMYQRLLQSGKSHKEALFEARDMLDFSKRGANPVLRVLIEVTPFLNPAIQSIYRLGAGITRKNVGFILLRGLVMALASAALAAWNADNDDYKALTMDQKSTYWHFYNTFQDGDHIQIPKPFEVGAILGTIPEAIADAFITNADEPDHAKQAFSLIGHALGQAMNLVPDPQVIKPALELAMNKNFFTGAPILNQGDKDVLPEDQDGPGVNPTFRLLAHSAPDFAPDFLRSPKQVQHLVRGYLSNSVDYVLWATDKVSRQAMDEPEPPKQYYKDWPGLRDFYSTGPARRTKYDQAMFQLTEEAGKVYQSLQDAKKAGDADRVEQLLDENEGLLAARKPFDTAQKKVLALRKKQRALQLNDTMEPQDRREMIDEIQRTMNEVAESVYDIRPGGKLNSTVAADLIGRSAKEKADILRKAGLPATAALVKANQ